MNWLYQFFTSSIGRKAIMSLTGLFLIMFLTVHLIGNLQLLAGDGGKSFNIYADFMGHNPLIQTVSIGNFFFIILHAIQGILLYFKNKGAKGSKYAVRAKNDTSFAAKNMAILGTLILAFLLMHLGHFYYQFKFNEATQQMVTYDGGAQIVDAYSRVYEVLTQTHWMILYLVGLIVLALHLNHGFASAFQTLGLRHSKYTPIISFLGKAYSIVVPIGFAIIPLYLYFTK
jgi:succinate dehydrogenase (or fumarate reductase) cytochrome b subunit, b558 family